MVPQGKGIGQRGYIAMIDTKKCNLPRIWLRKDQNGGFDDGDDIEGESKWIT